MRRTLRSLFFSVLGISLGPTSGLAGAWTLAEGEGQLIVTTGRNTAPPQAMIRGLANDDKSSVYVFVEYGLTDNFTVGGKASGEWLANTMHLDLRLGLHGRYRLWQGEKGDVFSVHVGGSWPVEGWFGDPLMGGTIENVPEAELSILYGRGWVSDWGNSFVSIETGYRWRGNDEPDEIRFEGTAGHSLSKRLMGLFGAYIAYPVGNHGEPSMKLAPSVAWTMWPRLGANDKKPADYPHPSTFQLGVSYDLLSHDDGLGFYVSIWNRF